VKTIRIISLVMVLPFLTGCGTVVTHTLDDSDLPASLASVRFYRGTRLDAPLLGELSSDDGESKAWAEVLCPFIIIDIPLSVVGDTLLVPVDMFRRVPAPESKPDTCKKP
jgi:uncharacterized protein YceK